MTILRRLTLLVVLVASTGFPAWAMEHHADVLRDQYGNALGGATVRVYNAGTTTLATIYSDNGSTVKENPFLTDALTGRYGFYADNGVYDLSFSHQDATFDADHTRRIALFDVNDYSGGGGGGEGGGVTGWPTTNTAAIAFADSEANAARIGNGTNYLGIWWDPTLGGMIKPSTLGDSYWRIWANYNGCIRDMEANGGLGLNVLCFDPDAATPRGKYLFQTGYYPLKSVYLPAGYWDGDGTQCPSQATTVTINSGPRMPTFICADNSGSTLHATLTLPPDYVAGTTLTVRQRVIQTAANTGSVLGNVSSQCRGNTETVSSTWGADAAISFASTTGSNATNYADSAAMTPAGTCNPGDLLSIRYVFDAASTGTSATLHFVGFDLVYSSESLSH